MISAQNQKQDDGWLDEYGWCEKEEQKLRKVARDGGLPRFDCGDVSNG